MEDIIPSDIRMNTLKSPSLPSASSSSNTTPPIFHDGKKVITNDCNPIQINGRKIIGPPHNWNGPEPSNSCELFIKKIPKKISEYILLTHFKRFGQIYEFRIMMDFHGNNRGYAYIKYTNENDAMKAKQIMNHFFIKPKRLLEIQNSYDKCRLFVGNLPKELTKDEIEIELRKIFPKLKTVVLHNRIQDNNYQGNRGFAFIDFPTHKDALEVKKLTSPGRIRKWDRDLKIVWANQEKYIDPEVMMEAKSLFIRNVEMSVSNYELQNLLRTIVNANDIEKISKIREFAFINFRSRCAAEKVLDKLQGYEFKGYKLHIEWTLPTKDDINTANVLKKTDFDAKLRLKCIANYWQIPMIIFGRVFDDVNEQCAAILIKNAFTSRVIFLEITTTNLIDIQSRLCETVCKIIDQNGGLPFFNYVIKIIDDSIHIVGVMNLENATFSKARDINANLTIHLNEIRDLCYAAKYLDSLSYDEILCMYNNFLQNAKYDNYKSYFYHRIANDRILGCLHPVYRNKPEFKYGIDNTQIIFVLCHIYSLTNYLFPQDNNTKMQYFLKDDNQLNNNNNNNCNGSIDYFRNFLLPSKPITLGFNELRIDKVYYGTKSTISLKTNNEENNSIPSSSSSSSSNFIYNNNNNWGYNNSHYITQNNQLQYFYPNYPSQHYLQIKPILYN